jgi:transcriptional regulator with XRE-family HTH domain
MAKRRQRQRASRWDEKLVRPTAVDRHVGARVRQRRTMVGMSQIALAGKLGITFQQLQKNERGINRIASSRLVDLSLALDVPIQFFFDDMPADIAALPRTASAPASDAADILSRLETLRLVRAYYRIKDPRVRRQVYGLAKTLAADAD